MADSASGWNTGAITTLGCLADGARAYIAWLFVEAGGLRVRGLDAAGNLVCEEHHTSYSIIPQDEHRTSNPFYPSAVIEAQKHVPAAFETVLHGIDDHQAILDSKVDYGVMGNVNRCTLNSDGTFECQ